MSRAPSAADVARRRDESPDADVLRTEFPFELPYGYVDGDGAVHKAGVMRLATARDEILPLRDPRVRDNEAYLTVVLLSRVITGIDGVERVTPQLVENLFAADLAHLQDLYNSVNRVDEPTRSIRCPSCGDAFPAEAAPFPGSSPIRSPS